MSLTDYVHKRVEQRGFLDGWTKAQIIARQLVKAVDELGELVDHIDIPGLPPVQMGQQKIGFGHALSVLSRYAADVFKDKELWQDISPAILNRKGAAIEAVDVIIPILVALKELEASDDDIRLKAANDVARPPDYKSLETFMRGGDA